MIAEAAMPWHAGKSITGALKGEEIAVVDQPAIVGMAEPTLQRANVLLRLKRNPVVGDKYSSRHGQKGVLSQLWPDSNMPLSPTPACGVALLFASAYEPEISCQEIKGRSLAAIASRSPHPSS